MTKRKNGSWVKTDYDRVMNKTMDGAFNLSTSIAKNKILRKNEMSLVPPVGVSIQILLEELLFAGYSETKLKETLNKCLKLAIKNQKWFVKECEKKAKSRKKAN